MRVAMMVIMTVMMAMPVVVVVIAMVLMPVVMMIPQAMVAAVICGSLDFGRTTAASHAIHPVATDLLHNKMPDASCIYGRLMAACYHL